MNNTPKSLKTLETITYTFCLVVLITLGSYGIYAQCQMKAHADEPHPPVLTFDNVTYLASECYTDCGKVIAIEDDLITVQVGNGNQFSFYDDSEDWYIDDLCSMLMYTNGTSNTVYDDEIILTRYSGFVELFE